MVRSAAEAIPTKLNAHAEPLGQKLMESGFENFFLGFDDIVGEAVEANGFTVDEGEAGSGVAVTGLANAADANIGFVPFGYFKSVVTIVGEEGSYFCG